MKFITATKGTYQFDIEGTPQWEQRSDYEAQGDSTPQVKRTAYTIVETFTEQSYADNEARIHRLRNVLDACEGRLEINDENGVNVVNAAVRVRSDNVPRAWRQYVAEVTVVFEARGLTAAAGALPATFTPTGDVPVSLPNVSEWKVSIRTNRFSNEAPNRDETIETITASGVILADRALPVAERQAFLQQQLELLRKCNARDGKLKWGSEEIKFARVQSLDGDMGDGKDRLNWSLVAFYKTFPKGQYAQPEYTVSQRYDYEAGELIIAVRGRVKADTETEAKLAVVALKESYAAATRTIQNEEISDAIVGGVDASRDEGLKRWLELTFGFEYREPIPQFTGYQLRISTKQDARTADKVVTYEGRSVGTSATVALAAARSLGFNKLPAMTSSSETVASKKTSLDTAAVFVEVTFAYEYLSKSTTLTYAEVTREIVRPPFGEARDVISGFAAAASSTEAIALARSFKLTDRVQRETTERFVQRSVNEESLKLQRLEFTYVFYLNQPVVTLAYGVETTNEFESGDKTVVYSGQARGPSEAACNVAIDALMNGATGKLMSRTRKPDFERIGGATQFLGVSFTETFSAPGDLDPNVDIIDASYSVRTQWSVNRASLTLIPYGVPFEQTGVGWTPGVQTVSGSVKATREVTAKNWGKAKQGVLRSGGHIDLIEDDMQYSFVPMDGVNVKNYTYNFSFAARYQQLIYS